jgi:phenylalanyl-tRNA synthetase beta chain
VFLRDPTAPDSDSGVAGIRQPMRLAGLAFGAADTLQWGRDDKPVDLFDAKGDLEALFAPRLVTLVPDSHPALHPGRSARIELDGRPVGVIGELHPRWRQAYELPQAPVVFELELDALLERGVPLYQPIPKQQSAWRDLAIVLAERVSHEALVKTIAADPSGLVRSVVLFDVYKPAQPTSEIGVGEHSRALRIELLDNDATLTDERIDAAIAAAVARLGAAFGAKLRG